MENNTTAQDVKTKAPKHKIIIGEVVSNKMNKTIVVRVTKRKIHPVYKKVITTAKKFKVHDEKNEAKVNDVVAITQTRPLSKEKHFRLVRIIT